MYRLRIMGKTREKDHLKSSQTLPSSPCHSSSPSSSDCSSSSEFEFAVSLSPRKASAALCPADELFYKGQLLPLHPSPRISMVRTLLLSSSSSSSSSDAKTTAYRDSTGSSDDSACSYSSLLGKCDSSRPSSVGELDDDFKRFNTNIYSHFQTSHAHFNSQVKKPNKYFSLSRFSSVLKKDPSNRANEAVSGSSVKRMSATAKEVITKYLKKVKPLYEKFSQKQQAKMGAINNLNIIPTAPMMSNATFPLKRERSHAVVSVKNTRKERNGGISHSFLGNLRYPRRRSCVSSCPSSMRSSPIHSGLLCKKRIIHSGNVGGMYHAADTSSMEELQSAIRGAIAHCKNSMMQNNAMIIVKSKN